MQVVLSGRGRHLGTDVAWQLRCRPDGAFLEEIRGEHLSFSWGHPGGTASCWEVRVCTGAPYSVGSVWASWVLVWGERLSFSWGHPGSAARCLDAGAPAGISPPAAGAL